MTQFISVVVPVYNVKEYLDRCINSIINQTYSNLEIVLVDNGSTDGSSELCDLWSSKDNRIKVFHIENKGISFARNYGIEVSTGEYIAFIDSDDFIDFRMFEDMIILLDKYSADSIQCDYLMFQNENEIDNKGGDTVIEFSCEEAIRDLFVAHNIKFTACTFLIKKSIIDDIRFEENKRHEDVLWTYLVLKNSKKVLYLPRKYYYYFQRSNSFMHSHYSYNNIHELVALEEICKDVSCSFPSLYSYAINYYKGMCFWHYRLTCKEKSSDEIKEYQKEIFERYKKTNKINSKDKSRIKDNFIKKVFLILPSFACWIMNLYEDYLYKIIKG